ncbi:MAG: aminotransferase, partial [Clostridia bacterium]|nr:aminotransferase [Clostridia bacterium]
AYAVHDFTDTPDKLANVFEVAKKYGTENRILYFTSTSKITYPGAGVSLICAAKAVYDEIVSLMGTQTIGHDKLNQVRHVKFLKDANGLFDMMKKQAGIVRPHFEIAQKALEEGLGGLGIAQWHTPNGGYFISLNTLDDTASEIFRYMKEAGVTLTNVGATYPHGKDPHDSNLRLAPTYPSLSELEKAMQILVCTVKLVSAKKLLAM